MKSMKLMSLAVVAAGAVAISACGNGSGLLGGNNDSSSMNAEQAAAVAALADSDGGHWCQTCEVPPDGAEHLEVGIMPAEYAGGPLELIVSYVSPSGVVNADGSWRVEKTLTVNDVDLLATVPDAGWKISLDGKRARIRFEAPNGLPAGTYHVRGTITDPDLGSADNARTYTVEEHHEATPTPTPDHTPEATPTATPEHTPTPEPTATPI